MNEKFYVAPEVEIVEVAIEQGFAATNEDNPYNGNGGQGEDAPF